MENNTFISVFEVLKIGIGPSSSHTLGPWKAALSFLKSIKAEEIISLRVKLLGSLALTGKGHKTDIAIMAGLSGLIAEEVDLKHFHDVVKKVKEQKELLLGGHNKVTFNSEEDIQFLSDQSYGAHPNHLEFHVKLRDRTSRAATYYSIGGGFIVKEGESKSTKTNVHLTHDITSAQALEDICIEQGMSISDVALENERSIHSKDHIYQSLLNIWSVMKFSAYIGCHSQGTLPGGLDVKRRAFDINLELLRNTNYNDVDSWILSMQDGRNFKKVLTRVSCIAMAVNEVNADMGRIVTAPTNGSAGVIPAVLFYYICFSGQETSDEDIVRFLLTASEIGKLFKKGATISAAQGGCQAEIGVSSAMAAAALTEVMGGTPPQALMAAEIAMEHHLGLTCDPVKGLVQIPCIERNSMGAIKAINATIMALMSDPKQAKVSLDHVIHTMNETAKDMHKNYKETSLGGLATAVNVGLPEC